MEISTSKYIEIMDKIIEENQDLPIEEQLEKIIEEVSKYEIIDQ